MAREEGRNFKKALVRYQKCKSNAMQKAGGERGGGGGEIKGTASDPYSTWLAVLSLSMETGSEWAHKGPPSSMSPT